MQTTVKQQLAAIRKELNTLKRTAKVWGFSPGLDREIAVLNDAASTLAAIDLIGIEKIMMLSELEKEWRSREGYVIPILEKMFPDAKARVKKPRRKK